MKPFLTTRRRLVDLLILFVLDLGLYFLWQDLSLVVLFSFGFIWNWVAAQDLHMLFENKRYRYSMVRLVINLQTMFLNLVVRAPAWVKWVVQILPAGIFWTMVILFNDSSMPWWATFLGSLVFEIIQLESKLIQKNKEISP